MMLLNSCRFNYFDIQDIILSDAIKQLDSPEYQDIITEYENLYNIKWKSPKIHPLERKSIKKTVFITPSNFKSPFLKRAFKYLDN